MAAPEIDLLVPGLSGSVIAPAGCGKTQLIADTLARSDDTRPALVLTHTNAGRAALEQRMSKAAVVNHKFRIATLDSWAIRVAQKFPHRAGIAPEVLRVENGGRDYAAIRSGAVRLLQAEHLNEILQSTYSRVLVDEYQDCDKAQHALVVELSKVLPTVVLGDPLQAIFDFAGPVVSWKADVKPSFPHLGRLATPWRWTRAGAPELGQWLIDIRKQLIAGDAVDLRVAPKEVVWVELKGTDNEQHLQRMAAAMYRPPSKDGSIVVIADSRDKHGQRSTAGRTPGAFLVEALDMTDVMAFGRSFNPAAADALPLVISFASEMMTGLSPKDLLKRIETLAAGRARTEATPVERAALIFSGAPSFGTAALMLRAFADAPDVRVFRPDAL